MLAAAKVAGRAGVPVDEILAQRAAPSRRSVIGGIGALGLAGAAPLVGCRRSGFSKNPGRTKVVIVGGGLAGLSCLHDLAKAGIYAELYEALGGVGGRALTGRGLFAGGRDIVSELGGQFIDSWHAELLSLVDELGLSLLDRELDTAYGRLYYINGARYSEAELASLLLPVATAVDACYEVIENDGELISYQEQAGAISYDNQSLDEFLGDCEADEVARRVIEAAYLSEYGLELSEQSALNLILMMSTDPAALELYGGSDERYMVEGGVDQVATSLAELYADRVFLGQELSALIEEHDGSYTLHMRDGAEIAADVVVLTLPFTVLRRLDLQIEMSDVKRRSINELGYGTNAKVLLPFSTRFWREQGESGELYTSLPIQSGWDNTQLQGGSQGVIALHIGGAQGVALGSGTVAERAASCLADLEEIYPGCSQKAGTDPMVMHWPSLPTALGSYACYKVGQYTAIGGAEGEPVGNVFFAGEHCSWECQGYLNGAVQTGQQVAADVVSLLDGMRRWRRPQATRRLPLAPRLRLP